MCGCRLAENATPSGKESPSPGVGLDAEDVAIDTEMMVDSLTDEDAEAVIRCLEDVLRTLTYADDLIVSNKPYTVILQCLAPMLFH